MEDKGIEEGDGFGRGKRREGVFEDEFSEKEGVCGMDLGWRKGSQ